MKKSYLLLFTLMASSLAFNSAQAQAVCAQVIQPAVSPGGVCVEYATPCDVPTDWKAVPSCDLIEEGSSVSLEEKQNTRRNRMQEYWRLKSLQGHNNTRRTNQSFARIGSGAFTRSNRANKLPTSTDSTTAGIRATTQRDYSSDVAKRYSLKGGYERAGDTTSAERKERRAYRAPIYSRSDANREGNLNTTVKWNVLSRQHTTQKQYGPNPYRLRANYLAEQKAKRDATNREVDVQQRKLSRSRVYRGERLEGNLRGDDLLND